MASVWIGILFSAGLALVLMPLSATIITKTGNFALERQVRWGLLGWLRSRLGADARSGAVRTSQAALRRFADARSDEAQSSSSS